jgi:hypothetical protein
MNRFQLIVFLAPLHIAALYAQAPEVRKVSMLGKKLAESSALLYVDGTLFTLSDDKKPVLFRIDTATAKIRQTISIENASFTDKEALAMDDEYIYIGDVGNNTGSRRDLQVVRISKSDITASKELSVKGERISFTYPEQVKFGVKPKDNKFDCEAMVVMGDSIYLFTKQHNNLKTTLYALPKKPGTYEARKKGVFDVKGMISDATLSPDGTTLLLLGYGRQHQSSFIWKFTGFTGADFFSGYSSVITLSSEQLAWQTEGITFIDNSEVFISCEETNDLPAALYRLNVNDLLRLE